jgi:hypothetical protein
MKKFILLIFTLAIPVSIFLFLKIFGNNEFEVPILFENGIPGCDESTEPHLVPSFKLYLPDGSAKTIADIDEYLILGALNNEDSLQLTNQVIELVRIQDAFYEIGSPTFVFFSNHQGYLKRIINQFKEVGLKEDNYLLGTLDEKRYEEFLTCGLGLTDGVKNQLVLVDPLKRIRGIYNGLETDQTEQLILELKILRKKG